MWFEVEERLLSEVLHIRLAYISKDEFVAAVAAVAASAVVTVASQLLQLVETTTVEMLFWLLFELDVMFVLNAYFYVFMFSSKPPPLKYDYLWERK